MWPPPPGDRKGIDSNILHVRHIERRKPNRPPLSCFADAQHDKQVFSFSTTLGMLLEEYVGFNAARVAPTESWIGASIDAHSATARVAERDADAHSSPDQPVKQ
jgi:hypothetical protein